MADAPELISPAYRVPLSPEQSQWLGVFVVMWGEIDYFMGLCIAAMLKTEIFAAETLMVNMTTGPRLNLFNKLAREKINDENTKKLAKDFYADLSGLIDKRNHILHGMWGFETGSNPGNAVPAAYYSKAPDRPLLASELPNLLKDVSAQTHRIVAVFQHLIGASWKHDPANPPTWYFGKGPPPSWLGGSSAPPA